MHVLRSSVSIGSWLVCTGEAVAHRVEKTVQPLIPTFQPIPAFGSCHQPKRILACFLETAISIQSATERLKTPEILAKATEESIRTSIKTVRYNADRPPVSPVNSECQWDQLFTGTRPCQRINHIDYAHWLGKVLQDLSIQYCLAGV